MAKLGADEDALTCVAVVPGVLDGQGAHAGTPVSSTCTRVRALLLLQPQALSQPGFWSSEELETAFSKMSLKSWLCGYLSMRA